MKTHIMKIACATVVENLVDDLKGEVVVWSVDSSGEHE